MTSSEQGSDERPDLDDIRAIASRLAGSRLARVRYVISGRSWEQDSNGRQSVHEVDHAVQLITEDGLTVSALWDMQGDCEPLSVTTDPEPIELENSDITASDVSTVPEWASIMGQPITAIGASWREADDDCPRSVWSLRLEFGSAPSVAIALGEIRDDTVSYMPDSVVVLFGADLINSYSISTSSMTAWGETIHSSAPPPL